MQPPYATEAEKREYVRDLLRRMDDDCGGDGTIRDNIFKEARELSDPSLTPFFIEEMPEKPSEAQAYHVGFAIAYIGRNTGDLISLDWLIEEARRAKKTGTTLNRILDQ